MMKYLTDDDDILDIGLSFMKAIGECNGLRPVLLNMFRIFNIFTIIFTLWFTTANLSHANGVELLKTTEGISTTVHTLLKYLVYIYYKPDIEQLLENRAKFWNHHLFEQKISKKAKLISTYVKFVQGYVVVAMLFVIISYWLRPYLDEKARFMYDCFVYPNSIVLETIVLACQYYVLGVGIPIISGCDFVYFSYSIDVGLQLRLLNYKFKNMKVDTKIGDICCWIQHHQFLLTIFKNINFIYFWLLFFHYFVTLATSCSQLYIILLGLADTREIIALVLYNIAILVQFGYYTFPAEALVSELRNLSTSIYSSSWYDMDIDTQKLLLLVMVQAQQQKYMSLAGLVEVNVDAFSSVVRKSFSFYAIIKNLLNK